jgi:hypothetical protein
VPFVRVVQFPKLAWHPAVIKQYAFSDPQKPLEETKVSIFLLLIDSSGLSCWSIYRAQLIEQMSLNEHGLERDIELLDRTAR